MLCRSIQFVSAHRGDEESFRNSPLFTSIRDRHPIYAKLNNSEGLPLVYNRFLRGETAAFTSFFERRPLDDPRGIVVFVHDDLEVLGANIEFELNRWAEDGFAIMGLAGARSLEVKAPAIWTEMATPGSASGISVYHNTRPDTKTGAYERWPDQPFIGAYGLLGEVAVLDGMFLAVVKDAASAAGWEFDEAYDFHHYDLASCLRARQAGLKLRTVFLPCVHWSGGLTNMADPIFIRNQKTFLKEFRGTWSI